MTKVRVTLDKRASNTTKDKKYPLVLRISHQSKTRDISFNLQLREGQYDEKSGKITGIMNSVSHTKRVRKRFSDTDLWIDENQLKIRNWDVGKLKLEIETLFFNKQISRTVLSHAAIYLSRLRKEQRFSTADSYEDALKVFVKYRRFLKRDLKANDPIKTLFNVKAGGLEVFEKFKQFDLEISDFDVRFAKDFKAYMVNRFTSKNTPLIHLRSMQAIFNDASESYAELRDHHPLKNIPKQSFENAPNPLNIEDLDKIRNLQLEEGTPIWHHRNYMLFMFYNKGSNFFDISTMKVSQFKDNRIRYKRRKTHNKRGNQFNILQNQESLKILNTYVQNKQEDDYIFPLIPKDTSPERLHKVNNAKVKIFNKYAKKIAKLAGINHKITTYTMRDTWVNIGLDKGVSIRDISSGVGHSSTSTTEKHYAQKIKEQKQDEINQKITGMDYE